MKKPNRLIKEQSPYLLQHSYNPVNWYPWNDEAFEKAIEEDKPIFLSIGYSTCHWCHVMEKESFEDDEVAKLMNEVFVSIKVDREERPDIDGIYMNVCQMLTDSGGWPLTIIMTPDKKPFFAGTYFPKESRFGRIGMLELVPRIKELWSSKRDEIISSANEITSALINSSNAKDEIKIDEKVFDKAFDEFNRRFDHQFGGFGSAPKFPTPHNFLFLLRYWKRNNNHDALNIVEKSLHEIRNGGIFDHIGFGFHRYSTDREWLVPHFEKMLYDQALLAIAYTEIYQVTQNEFYKKTAEEIFTYVLRDITSPDGGFYSAEDADSEGEEGKFYLWSEEEIKSILKEDSNLFIKIFGVEEDGNWIDQMHGGRNGANILHLKKNLKDSAVGLNLSFDELEQKIKRARIKLFDHREKRIHSFKDDKILTDWNGLMISALAKAAQTFNNKQYLTTAEKAMEFILARMKSEDGKLLHRFRKGVAGIPANLDDYSFIVSAMIDLYESSFNTKYLKKAFELNDIMIKHFWDEKDGGFFFTSDDSEQLLSRQKEIYDGAIPSGNSVAILNLLRLSKISGNTEYEKKASRIIKTFSKTINSSPSSFTQFLVALDFAFGPSFEIVISGEKNSVDTMEMLETLNKHYLPNKIVILNSASDKEIKLIAPFTVNQEQVEHKTTVYVCKNYECKMPITKKDDLEKLLNGI
ncbi:MAG: thioredoxin domain-containing protein [Bacteroidetes bacterium]|nr:thioredoxin domain-containing protein [Bacteroidota bacterium]